MWDGGGGGSGGGEAWVTGSVVGGCTGGAGSGMELNSGLRAWVFVSLPRTVAPTRFADNEIPD